MKLFSGLICTEIKNNQTNHVIIRYMIKRTKGTEMGEGFWLYTLREEYLGSNDFENKNIESIRIYSKSDYAEVIREHFKQNNVKSRLEMLQEIEF